MALNMQLLLQKLQFEGLKLNSQILSDLIYDHSSVRQAMLRKYNAYKASELPILKRQPIGLNKANNKLVNDYRGEIVDQLTGYLFGNPVSYTLSTKGYTGSDDPRYVRDAQSLQDFKQLNHMDELDGETGKFMSICGRAARLLYIDCDGKERAMHVDPWECIFIYDQSLDEVQYALRYYNVYDMDASGQVETRTRVEWYDDKNVYYYLSGANGIFLPDNVYVRIGQDLQPVSQQPHFFDRVPLIDFQNNRELLGDFEKHESLIDGYDRLVSDAQNEIEEFRQAYLIFKGVTPDAETIKQAKESGAFGCEKEDSIEYLTKQINDQFVENQKKTLRENIYRFSKTVDVNADTFTGSGASGEARKWLLLALENRGSKMALKFQSGTHRMFRVLSSSWKRKAIGIEPDAIEVTLDRNLPVELKTEAEIQQALNGVVSNRTRLKLFSPVKDVDAEMKEMEEENDLKINLDDVPTDDPQKTKDQQSVQDGIMTQEEFDAKWGTAQ